MCSLRIRLASWITFIVLMLAIVSNSVWAQIPPTQFQIVGHIENFCLDNQFNAITGTCPKDAEVRPPIPTYNPANLPNTLFIGAKIVVNGVTVTIPRNTVVVMPARYLTSWQIFSKAQGVSRGNNESGLALQDKVKPLAAFEVALDGNIVGGVYIAGLVHISQQSLNMGAGYITNMYLPTGFMCVGPTRPVGIISPIVSGPEPPCAAPNTRIRLNDPKITDTSDPAFDPIGNGRYGRPNIAAGPITSIDPDSRFPDPRFTVDQGNPTVHALTGYPMCVPRLVPDPKCPTGNRPVDTTALTHLATFIMGPGPVPNPVPSPLSPPPGTPAGFIPNCVKKPTGPCEQDQQAPLVIGDFINYQGTLAKDATGMYVSAHTVVANVGIYTESGVDPTYVTQEVSLIGTMGPLGPSPQTTPVTPACTVTMECQDRLKVEGFTTDPLISSPTSRPPNPTARQVNVYALDVDLSTDPTGATKTIRRIGTAADFRAVPLGRFRKIVGKGAAVNFDSAGVQRGITRELMVRIDTLGAIPARNTLCNPTTTPACVDPPPVANGLVPGQFTAPIGEYIFPEPLGLGDPPSKFNFQCLAFLTAGWALATEDPAVTTNPPNIMITPGQLTPWPDSVTPVPVFDPPGTPATGTGVNCRN